MCLFTLFCVFSSAFAIILQAICVESVQEINSACGGGAVQRKHSTCVLNYHVMVLWCSDTNFTSIPLPEDIAAYADPSVSKELYFNSSCLESVNPGVLCHYKRLKVLSFDSNYISQIEDSTFSSCQSLENLVLSRNRIRRIGDKAFQELRSLQRLSLSENQMERITSRMFADLHNVVELLLDRNQLSIIDENAFKDMEKLTNLDLSGNKLITLSWGKDTVFPQLKVLKLNDNQLQRYDAADLRFFTDLKELDLSNNNLTCIADGNYFRERHLSSLRLSSNKLTTPNENWFRNVYREKQLPPPEQYPLADNPWRCDCTAQSYWEFLTEDITQPEWRLALDVQCAYPQEQRGKRLRLLTSDYFHSCASRKDRGDECLTHPPTVEVLADPSPEQSQDGWGFLGNNPLHYMIIGAVAVAFLCIVLILIYCTIRKYKTQRRHKGNKQLSEEKQSQLKIDGSGEEDHRTPLCEQYYSRGHRPSSGYESIASSQQSNLLTRESESSNNSSNTLPKVVSRRIRYDSGISEGQLSQSSRDSVLMERQHTGPLHKIEEQQTASDSVFVHSTSESQFQSRGPGAYAPRRDTFQQFYPITHSQSYSAPQQVPVVPHYHAPGYQQGNFFPNRASVMTAPSAPYPNNVAV